MGGGPAVVTKTARQLFGGFYNYLNGSVGGKSLVFANKRKTGFTLAEVLISLGIIGVVAALTMPSLITKHQKMVFAAKAKQTYSILSNALITSVAENGPMSEWNYGQSYEDGSGYDKANDVTYIVNTYFKPYLKIAEDIGYKNNTYSLLLSNGMTLTFRTDGYIEAGIYTPSSIYIIVSNNRNTTHNTDKSRDYSRHDLFFQVSKDTKNTVYPFAWSDNMSRRYLNIKSRDELINHQNYGCRKEIVKNQRFNCTALMLWDNWQIKDDYPW